MFCVCFGLDMRVWVVYSRMGVVSSLDAFERLGKGRRSLVAPGRQLCVAWSLLEGVERVRSFVRAWSSLWCTHTYTGESVVHNFERITVRRTPRFFSIVCVPCLLVVARRRMFRGMSAARFADGGLMVFIGVAGLRTLMVEPLRCVKARFQQLLEGR